MPLDKYEWLEKGEILSFEEIARLAALFVQLGVEKIRLTGGKPLVRRDLDKLVAQLSALPGPPELCLTTNGSLLAEKVAAFKAAGLRQINVSLDSLDLDKFRRIRKRGDLAQVLEGLFAAKRQGLHPIKINAVIGRGVNDDEVLDLVAFAREHGFAMLHRVHGRGQRQSLEIRKDGVQVRRSWRSSMPIFPCARSAERRALRESDPGSRSRLREGRTLSVRPAPWFEALLPR